MEILYLVGGFARLDDLKEDDPIDEDRGIVLGNDGLARNLQNRFLHIQFSTDGINERDYEVQAWIQCGAIAPESLNRPLGSLRDNADAFGDGRQRERGNDQHKDQISIFMHVKSLPSSRVGALARRRGSNIGADLLLSNRG